MTRTEPLLTTTVAEFTAAKHQLLAARGRQVGNAVGHQLTLGLVPTMGALHAGHVALMRAAREQCDVVVATIFVNPLQFGDPTDLERYPKTLDEDLRLLGEAGVDVVFAPSVEEVYPNGLPAVSVQAGPLASVLEGASRPGHFDGVLTVVTKLLHLGAPPFGGVAEPVGYKAFFGQKDAQQLALIRLMVRELNFPVDIVPVPTVRESDGLAMSSRNRFLDAQDRENALALSATLREARRRVEAGEPLDVGGLREQLAAAPGVELDYLELVDALTLAPVGEAGNAERVDAESAERLLVVAARVGSVRLIDNVIL
ncbi:pantoate--beta-alanine ligase [Haematomicrobium sanguinis]|uniref:pantoate--beta-alanine ligase n=1 Tax=Haematomicrobium sanguinis TaxID=479106 RepID=UPI00047A2267